VAFFVFLLKVVYSNTSSVAGWSEGDSYVLSATIFFTYATLIMLASANLMEIPEKVRKGTLDFDLIKPVDSQFLVSIRKFHFDEFGTILGGVVMLVIGLVTANALPGILEWCAYLLMCACAVAIFYSFQFMLMTLGIWLVRVDNLWVLGETVYYIARFPIDIYRAPIRTLLTYYIPIAFIAAQPTLVLLGRRPATDIFVSLSWTVAFFVFSRLFWKFALSKYSSASS
jgi:ABC-2 type transport system permease protein